MTIFHAWQLNIDLQKYEQLQVFHCNNVKASLHYFYRSCSMSFVTETEKIFSKIIHTQLNLNSFIVKKFSPQIYCCCAIPIKQPETRYLIQGSTSPKAFQICHFLHITQIIIFIYSACTITVKLIT